MFLECEGVELDPLTFTMGISLLLLSSHGISSGDPGEASGVSTPTLDPWTSGASAFQNQLVWCPVSWSLARAAQGLPNETGPLD